MVVQGWLTSRIGRREKEMKGVREEILFMNLQLHSAKWKAKDTT